MKYITTLIAIIFLAGCTTTFKGNNGKSSVKIKDSGAKVKIKM